MGICWSSTPNNPIPTGTVTPAGISYSQAASSGSYGTNSTITSSTATTTTFTTSSGSSSNMSSSSSSINRSNFSSVSDYSIGGQILPTSNLRVFTFAELKTATKNFRLDNLLGEGGFGKVYKGWLESSRNSSGTTVAVKKLNTEGYQGFEEWQSEIHFLGRLYHPNLVKLLGYCYEETELLLVYEYMQRGSLENHLFGRGAAVQPLPWDLRLKIAIGAACGLSFLHTSDREIIYRDFKASNILLDGSYNAKISDFGLAKLGPSASQSHLSTTVMGTPGYAAPEYMQTGHLYVKSDVYGFGVVLVEILTGLRAVDLNRPSGRHILTDWIKPELQDRKKLKKVMDPQLGDKYPIKAALPIAKLAISCLAPEPKLRPSMRDVLERLQGIQAATNRTVEVRGAN
ncbi:putative transferase, protein kinase RLK-Pelle-RLCK-VIIa-2 family [Medicago truncatula]|uniref:non-specific serine/threonine protein kinase n=1 Tax=Medicago truncatula TaxID=3880 RepID=G7KFF6_MEDTR|nr:probable serine/threonine-protein kinase PIX13 [Medicago truncatula]AET01073.1 Serine/Threonine kinase family protein [Medicago truncatula]RHN58211.1 putative transferase, protein kinase RLK-Pelle-RLCK-VIIa-2 family [Medicago truncatula]